MNLAGFCQGVDLEAQYRESRVFYGYDPDPVPVFGELRKSTNLGQRWGREQWAAHRVDDANYELQGNYDDEILQPDLIRWRNQLLVALSYYDGAPTSANV